MTVHAIADELDVSERTIHRDLKSLETTISDYNLTLQKQTGSGIKLVGDEHAKRKLEAAMSATSVSEYIPGERQTIILLMLLEAKGPVKLFTLASHLYVTTATISNDLDELENILERQKLRLVRKRGYGVQLDGRESDKRFAITELIRKYMEPFQFISNLKTNGQQDGTVSDAVSDRLLGLVDRDMLAVIEAHAAKTRQNLSYPLADSAYFALIAHLALAIERLRNGDTIIFNPHQMERIKTSTEYTFAKQLIRDLESELDMVIPDDEIGYITMHLQGAKLQKNHDDLPMDTDMDVAYLATALIQYVSEHVHHDLTQNHSLFNDLVAHLKPSLYRLEQELTIHNPLLEEIKEGYGDLFHLLGDAVEHVYPDIVFPDDEIGYLVFHFAAVLLQDETTANLRALVICSSGIGTAKILATRLKQYIPEIKQVKNISMFDVDEDIEEQYDIMISTIPLPDVTHDYILTSPMLTDDEVKKIKHIIRKKQRVVKGPAVKKANIDTTPETKHLDTLEKTNSYSAAIVQILHSLEVRTVPNYKDLPDVIGHITQTLADSDVIGDADVVTKQLLDRQHKNGVGIPNTPLALFHTRSDAVNRPSFTIHMTNAPVPMQAMDNQMTTITTFLFMLAPLHPEPAMLKALSYLSSLLVYAESVPVLTCGDTNQIRNYLSRLFYNWLYENIKQEE